MEIPAFARTVGTLIRPLRGHLPPREGILPVRLRRERIEDCGLVPRPLPPLRGPPSPKGEGFLLGGNYQISEAVGARIARPWHHRFRTRFPIMELPPNFAAKRPSPGGRSRRRRRMRVTRVLDARWISQISTSYRRTRDARPYRPGNLQIFAAQKYLPWGEGGAEGDG
jgi:hypothetical protein